MTQPRRRSSPGTRSAAAQHMRDLVAADLAMARDAANFDLADGEERARSSTLLTQLFLDACAATEVETAYEIGAREGVVSRRLRRALPEARLFALEANPHTYERFNRVERWTALRVEYLQHAVTDTTGPATFRLQKERRGRSVSPTAASHSLRERTDDAEYDELEVPGTTLTDFATDYGMNGKRAAIWIDAEGETGHVLSGADELLADVAVVHCEVESKAKWRDQWLWRQVHLHLAERDFVAVARDFAEPAAFNVLFLAREQIDAALPALESYYSSLRSVGAQPAAVA